MLGKLCIQKLSALLKLLPSIVELEVSTDYIPSARSYTSCQSHARRIHLVIIASSIWPPHDQGCSNKWKHHVYRNSFLPFQHLSRPRILGKTTPLTWRILLQNADLHPHFSPRKQIIYYWKKCITPKKQSLLPPVLVVFSPHTILCPLLQQSLTTNMKPYTPSTYSILQVAGGGTGQI